jgi:hypothetical protein
MSITASATDESLARVHDLPSRPRTAPEEPGGAVQRVPKVALTAVERIAVTRLVTGDPEPVVAHAVDRASALSTDESCRRRTLAKALAIADTQAQQFSAALVDAVAKRDDDAARMLDRLLKGATRRVCWLSEALMADFAGGKKSVLVIGRAEQVTVGP